MDIANSILLSNYRDIQPVIIESNNERVRARGKQEISFKGNHIDLNESKI